MIRWREFSFSLYRKWEWKILDSHDAGSHVVIWMQFVGSDPSEPETTLRRYEDFSLLKFEIENGLLVGCHAMTPTLEGHVDASKTAADAN